MKKRKSSCPVKFETPPESKPSRKLSKKKLQTYIPFTTSKQEKKDQKHPVFQLNKSMHNQRPPVDANAGPYQRYCEQGPKKERIKERKDSSSVYSKLLEPYHRLAKHNVFTGLKQGKEDEKEWRRAELPGPRRQSVPSTDMMAELSPTLSTDSGIGGCSSTTVRHTPWGDNMTRIVTGKDATKQSSDNKAQHSEIIVSKQTRRNSQQLIKEREKSNRDNVFSKVTAKTKESWSGACKDVNRVLTRRQSLDMHKVDSENNIRTQGNKDNSMLEVLEDPRNDRILQRKCSGRFDMVDDENYIRLPVRRQSRILDLVDELCKGANGNYHWRTQKKETGRRVSLEKDKKAINLRKFFIPSKSWGCVKKFLLLSYELERIEHLEWNGCSIAPASGEMLLSFNTTFPTLGTARVCLVHTCTAPSTEVDPSMLWYAFLAQ